MIKIVHVETLLSVYQLNPVFSHVLGVPCLKNDFTQQTSVLHKQSVSPFYVAQRIVILKFSLYITTVHAKCH